MAWDCRARKQGTSGGNDPADCDWPVCGCDPRADEVLSTLEEQGYVLAFVAPDQWRALPDTCYGLHGLLNWHESRPRSDVDTMTTALAILRELLRRRPAEFGGPMEVR